MVLIVYCEHAKAEIIFEQLGTDICSVTTVKWEASLMAATLLLGIIFYMLWKFKYRCHKTLLTFHNLRAAVAILLFAINTIELAKALLPLSSIINDAGGGVGDSNSGKSGYENNNKGNGTEGNLPQQQKQQQTFIDNEPDHIIVVIGFASLANALSANILTIILIWYHRLVELKKSLEFLYVSSSLVVLIFILRIYELAEIVYNDSIFALESVIQSSSAFCLLLLAILDGFTVYKERYRPDYLEDYDKIGYRHSLATFYSKACFWWLVPLLWFGYKEPLELEDLGQMRLEDSARANYDRFLLIYKTAKVKNSNKPPSLWLCYLKSSWRMFTLGGLLKLFGDLFAVIGPLAIQQIVQYIENMYGMHNNPNNKDNNALQQMSITQGNMTNGNNIRRDNTSIATPEIKSSLLAKTLSASLSPASLSSLLSLKENENLGTSIRNHINIPAAVVKTLQKAKDATTATGLIWMPNFNVSYTNNNNTNSYNNINNEIANSIDNTDVTSFSSDSLYSSSLYTSNLYSSGAEVKIYYPTWLDLLSNGWAIAWIVLLAALAQGALSQASTHILNMTGIRIKTSLQGLIYRKTLLLNSTCLNGGNDGTTTTITKTTTTTTNNDSNSYTNDVSADRFTPETENEINKNSVNSKCHNKNDFNISNNKHKDYKYLEANKVDRETKENSLSDIGAITNLMSEDTLNIMSFFWIAHYVWAIPLKIGVVMYLLYLKLGISAVIGSFVCILTMTPLQFLIGKAMSQNAEVMAKYTDNRLKRIHDCFVGIKLIKLNAWDNVFIRKITEARNKELKYLNKDSFYWTLMTILTHISSVLITFVTLAVYVYCETGAELTASRLFSALALFQQLTVPLLIFPITVPIIISAVVSTKRLENFLSAPEIQKQFEGIRNMARILSKSDASLDMYETSDKSQSLPSNISLKSCGEKPKIKIVIPDKPAPLANSEPHTPLGMSDTKEPLRFSDDHRKLSLHARKELLRNTPYVVIRPRKMNMTGLAQVMATSAAQNVGHKKTDSWHRDSLLLKMPDDIAVSVKDCKFSWHPQKLEQILYISDMVIPKGKLTMIVGKNGSGKSSLLSALLMEMPLISGDMIWNKTSTIAFVPQQPWLLNASIRENILFGEYFRPRRYDVVLEVCALKPDIDLMPAGDLTVIGERGINLSGGQRQRVAIARALYSSANVVIMDDPLSSLDNEVARHIFEQSIKKMLLKANRTVILVTQQLNLLQQAHNLIVLKDSCLLASGSYKDIEITHPHIIAKWNSIIAKANAKEQQNYENAVLYRTARERWKLFKNVTKLGLQRSISIQASATGDSEVDAKTKLKTISMENVWASDDNEDQYSSMMPVHCPMISSNTSFKLKRKPSSVYGSRHLIYEVPLPIDECQTENVILRRRRRTSSRNDSQQKPRPSSRTSSRLSNISNTPTELRRSLLTNSCSSANSYMTNLSGSNYGDETHATRTQSWQPCGTLSSKQHQTVVRNISSPPTFEEQQVTEEDERDSDAALMNDLVKTNRSNNGFQQFLKRMSMRRSFKPKKAVVTQQNKKLLQNTGSILSISEESGIVGCSAASVPSIELSSVAVTDTETETEGWIAGIENEEAIQDANSDYKMLLANNGNDSIIKAGATATDKQNCIEAVTELETTSPTLATNLTKASVQTRATTTATISYDVERKYGKIPAEIYLLYLRASGLTIVLVFFITALIWQALRVYTDVWLQQWTDDNTQTNVQRATASNVFTKNISGLQHQQAEQQMRQNYTTTTTTNKTIIMNAFTSAAASASASVSHVVDQQTTLSENVDHHEVTYYFHIYAVISCVCIVMAMISTPAGQWSGCKARQNLHNKLLQSIMHKSLHFFQITPLGRIMNRFSNDMAIIDKKIAATSQRLLQFTLLCLCAILINVIITPWFIVVTIPVCLAYYAIQKFYRCSSRELQRIENATNTPVISHLSETIQGVTTIRAYNQEARFTEILFRRLEENAIAFTILNTSNRWLGISLDYLGGFIVFVAIVTALLAATIASNNYSKQLEQLNSANNNKNNDYTSDYMTSRTTKETLSTLLPLTPTPSLVGLAINYTLLMPIYLNWVVKLLADMEMYIGSVERVAYYAETSEDIENIQETKNKRKSKREEHLTSKVSTSNNNVTESHIKHAAGQHENNEDIKLKTTTTKSSADNNDKCLNLSETNKIKTDDTTTNTTVNVNDDDDSHHRLNDDGFVTANSLITTEEAIAKYYDNQDNTEIALLPRCTTSAATEMNMKNKKDALTSNSNISTTPLERNDAERRASVRYLAKCKTQYKPVAISWPQRGDISFENVSLRYEGETEDVIKNLNLIIPAGQKIGICGRTGSGKSSLALSLFGVLQISHGCIRIDGNDIATIHPDEVRTRLSIIPQDVHLFSMTVRDNLDPSGYYSDLELWNCLELAQLKEFVNTKMPVGLDTEIMDGGLHLSLGHRQLFCLARAILRGSFCLVLDEATSSLDSTTEKALLNAAHKAFQGRTIITIAHRLSTIMDYDRIIVLDKGKIIEDGRPEELKHKSDGIFSTLIHSGRPYSAVSLDDVLNDT